ncbi:MAG TPA: hypothetical protein VGC24_10295 [Burkholderiaceae bacterium]
MTLLHTTMIMMTVSCALMLIGFSAREYKWAPGLMLLGILGAVGTVTYNIYQLIG